MGDAEVKVVRKKLADYIQNPDNPVAHDPRNLGVVVDSIQKVGAFRSGAASKGKILAGNLTWEAMAEAGIEDVIEITTDGKTWVIVNREDLTPEQEREAAYYDQQGAMLARFDADQLLADMETGFDPSAIFREDEIQAILAGMLEGPPEDPGAQVDRAAELQEEWGTALGQCWVLGDHRLVIGDCTDAAVVESVMRGERADAVVTDPPYGIEREGILNDDPEGLRGLYDGCLAAMPIDNAVVIAFQSPRLFWVWLDAVRDAGHKVERTLWSYKPNGIRYPWRGWILKSDLLLVSSLGKPSWPVNVPDCHDCYQYTHEYELAQSGGWHGSVKPVEVVESLVAHTGGDVYDPFVGSGTTIIACERLGRKCRAIELDPGYCAVAIQRFFDTTQVEPRLLA